MNFDEHLLKYYRIEEAKRTLKRPAPVAADRYADERKRNARFDPPPPPRFDAPITR